MIKNNPHAALGCGVASAPDWVVGGKINEGSYATRISPVSHNSPINIGGGTEILPKNPNSVGIEWFHMPNK